MTKSQNSFFVRLRLPEGLSLESREQLSLLVPRVAQGLSFQGLEDWSVDLARSEKVLGAEAEFLDLSNLRGRDPEMRVYFAKRLDAARFGKLFGSVFGDLGIGKVERLAPRDWMKLWRKFYKTQILREGRARLAIVPAWKKVPARVPSVRITPGQAFGTGTHPTTQLCVQLLLARGAGPRVLDFGAGTGVLGLAAAKLFASKVAAVESDVVALEQCRKNARLNRARGLRFLRKMPRGKFDLVFANVLAPVLLAHRAALLASVAPGGRIFLSGILAAEAKVFLKEFRAPGFALVEVREMGDWAAIELSRKG